MDAPFQLLATRMRGRLLTDETTREIYATDASLYHQKPLAVAIPNDDNDLKEILSFAKQHHIPVTPRAAGTSLAGQATGNGIVTDFSVYFRNITEVNIREGWAEVEPGVVRDELNLVLKPLGYMFCPETSTSNRCMIGGMIANNSCGEHSLIYGSTRDHLISVNCMLSDGSTTVFGPESPGTFLQRCNETGIRGAFYRMCRQELGREAISAEIKAQYPHPSIRRRNNGYALDELLDSSVFDPSSSKPFNAARLICGSEGTLALITRARVNIVPIPKTVSIFLCAHFSDLSQAIEANLTALSFEPTAIELIDKVIIKGAMQNPGQHQNCFFIQGDPEAILIIELAATNEAEAVLKAEMLCKQLKDKASGYHYPIITGKDMDRVRNLRKAGLGILTNVTTDLKPHSFVEDTAVRPGDLPGFMNEFRELLKEHDTGCAYYGHIATGELHLKPILDLRTASGLRKMEEILRHTATLVKKYKGSFSGEHGDGRLRAGELQTMLGPVIYDLLLDIKAIFDPGGILNPGKITCPPPLTSDLRETRLAGTPEPKCYFDFSDTNGLLRAVERCNGSADCRKSHHIGGVMCPSYMATLDESCSTRARANLLREALHRDLKEKKNPWKSRELYNILDLCLMCKGCKTECPSGIDMTRYKTEFLQHHHDFRTPPLRSRFVASVERLSRMGMAAPAIYNACTGNRTLKKILGFDPDRTIPALPRQSFRKWLQKHQDDNPPEKSVAIFADEFTNYQDADVGIAAAETLVKLGYHLITAPICDSGRAALSKGFVKKAKRLAVSNLIQLSDLLLHNMPIVGIEPSAILSFRDEYPSLSGESYKDAAQRLATQSFTFEEFIEMEFRKGNIRSNQFTDLPLHILLHGHCHQKALSEVTTAVTMLSIPENYTVEEIPSGCCGMAGSFGYEAEHSALSFKIGELVLFPSVRKANPETAIAAPGTSCRQQIADGTGRKAFHPAQILRMALKQ